MSGKPTRKLAETIHGIERLALDHALTPQLGRIVLPDFIEFEDREGNKVGEYENGEYKPRNGPKPPVASLPIVTADGPFVRVRWDGMWGDPLDPRHHADPDIKPAADVTFLEIHMSLDPEFAPDRVHTYAGGFDAKGPGGDATVGPLVEGGTYWVGFRARSSGGRLGDISGLVDIEVSGLNIDNGLFELALRADEVRDSADGKNSVHYGDEEPQPRPRLDSEGNPIFDEDGNQVVIPHKDGDLWFDTSVDDDGRQSNMPHVWSEAEQRWVSAQDSRIEQIQDALDDFRGEVEAEFENGVGSRTFYRPTEPTAEESSEGDLWFNTAEDAETHLHRYTDGVWVSVDDARVGALERAQEEFAQELTDAEQRAIDEARDLADQARSDAASDATSKADAARDAAISDAEAKDLILKGEIEDAVDDLRKELDDIVVDASGTKNFYQTEPPKLTDDPAPVEGDLWFDQNDQNKPHIFRDGEWVSVRDDSFLSTAKNLTPWVDMQDPPNLHAFNGQRGNHPSAVLKLQPGVMPLIPDHETVGVVYDGERNLGVSARVQLPFQGVFDESGNNLLPDGSAIPFEGRPISVTATAVTYTPLGGSNIQVVATFYDVEGHEVRTIRVTAYERDLSPEDAAEAMFIDFYGFTSIIELDDVIDTSWVGPEAVSFAMQANVSISQIPGNSAWVRSFETRVQVPENGIADDAITEAKLAAEAVTETKIAPDSISSPKIVAGAIQTSHLLAEAVTAEKMATGTITADSGIIGSLNAGVITAGTLDSARIEANSITADKLLVGGAQNLLTDPGFRSDGWGSSSNIIPGEGVNGANVLRIPQTSTTTGSYLGFSETLARFRFKASGGEKYRVSSFVTAPEDFVASRGRVYVRFYTPDDKAAGSHTWGSPQSFGGPTGLSPANEWVLVEGTVTAPPGAVEGAIGLYKDSNHTTSHLDHCAPVVRPMVGATLIENGAVTTDKIAAKAITAGKIDAGAVEAEHIVAGGIEAGSLIVAGSLGETLIADGAISTRTVQADAIGAEAIAAGVIEGEHVKAGSLTADKLLVGGDRNMVPNGELDKRSAVNWPSSGAYRETYGPPGNDDTPNIAFPSGTPYVYDFKNMGVFPVTAGETLVFECWVKSTSADAAMYFTIQDQNGPSTSTANRIQNWTSIEGDAVNGPQGPIAKFFPGTSWKKVASKVEVPEGVTSVVMQAAYFNHTAGSVNDAAWYMAGLKLYTQVGATLIQDGAITTEKIATGAITAESGIIGSLDAGKITVGEMDGARIKAGTVTADKVLIGGTQNLLPDPSFTSGLWTRSGDWRREAGGGPGGADRMVLVRTEGQYGSYYGTEPGQRFKVKPGAKYRVSARVRFEAQGAVVDLVPWDSASIYVRGYKPGAPAGEHTFAEPFAVSSQSTFAGAWVTVEGVVTMPSDCSEASIGLYKQDDAGDREVEFSLPEIYEVATSTLIDEGAITTEKIATGAITAESGIIGSLDAGVITTGELRGELIRAQSIAAESLAADAIDGKTITGATIQTRSAGARVVMNDSGLVQYNSLNQVIMDARNGRFSTVGNISTGMSNERRVILDNAVWGEGAGIIMAPDGSAPAARHGSRVGSPARRWIEIAAEERSGWGMRSRVRMRDSELEILQGRLYNHEERSTFGRLVMGSTASNAGHFELSTGTVSADLVRSTYNRIAADASNISITARNNLILRHGGDLQILDVPTYTGTTGGVRWRSGAVMVKDASSRRYKLAIESLTDTDPDIGDKLLSVDARTWFDSSASEALSAHHDSVLAGEPDDEAYDRIEPLRRTPGVIAEEMHDAGLDMFVVYDDEGRPDGVSYDRIGPALIPIIRDLRDRIIELEEHIRSS